MPQSGSVASPANASDGDSLDRSSLAGLPLQDWRFKQSAVGKTRTIGTKESARKPKPTAGKAKRIRDSIYSQLVRPKKANENHI